MSKIQEILQKIAGTSEPSEEFLETDEDVLDELMKLVDTLPDSVINDEIQVNAIPLDIKDGKVKDKKKDRKDMIEDILKHDNLGSYIPPTVLHTEIFSEEVIDKLLSIEVPTGLYRLTIRKLLKLPLRDLQ